MHQVSQLTVAPYWIHERLRERGNVSFAEAQQELIFLNRIWPQICMQPDSNCFVDASLRGHEKADRPFDCRLRAMVANGGRIRATLLE